MERYEQFVASLDSDSIAGLAMVKSKIRELDFKNCNKQDIENKILDMNPTSPRDITSTIYIIRRYARYLGYDRVQNLVDDISRKELWSKAKSNAPRKFISFVDYQNVCHEINLKEDYNSFYKSVLFRCLYEGIYNGDLSVIKNLRASDIIGNTVMLRDDDENSFERTISKELAEDLRKLGSVDKWDRTNGNGEFFVSTEGMYNDSCFKVEYRGGNRNKRYRLSYARIIAEISKLYMNCKANPSRIYVSGIMHRIGIELAKDGFGIESAFVEHQRNKKINSIIEKELMRSGYSNGVNGLREYVRGHLDEFETGEIAS